MNQCPFCGVKSTFVQVTFFDLKCFTEGCPRFSQEVHDAYTKENGNVDPYDPYAEENAELLRWASIMLPKKP